jgi:thioredoxin 1
MCSWKNGFLFGLLLLASCIRQPTSTDKDADPLPAPCKGCSSAVPLDLRLFDSLVIADSATAMVEFFDPSCPVCQEIAPMVDSLALVFKGRALVGKINSEQDTVLWRRYGVLTVPTFLFFRNASLVPKRYSKTAPDSLVHVMDSLLAAP